MELLGGEDMAHLRNRIRASSPQGFVPIAIASYLSRQMLIAVREMHTKGFIHRDIKPANFVRRSFDSTDFCMVDFGIAKCVVDKEGVLKPKRENAEFRGTTLYASLHAHIGEDQCSRDDMYGILFVFFDLICGKLPWSAAAKLRDKPQVASIKKDYVGLSNEINQFEPSKLPSWVANTIKEVNQSLNSDIDNFPIDAQDKCKSLLEYLHTLQYDSVVDYDLIDNLFLELCQEQNLVQNITYNVNGFDWYGGINKIKGLGSENNNSRPKDSKYIQQLLCARGRALGKSIQKIKRGFIENNNNTDISNHNSPVLLDFCYALQWRDLVLELFSIQESKIYKGTVDLFEGILRDACRFIYSKFPSGNVSEVDNVNISDEFIDDNQWIDFINVQSIIYKFSILNNSIIKRPREFTSFNQPLVYI
jgi:tau tubulin kinase